MRVAEALGVVLADVVLDGVGDAVIDPDGVLDAVGDAEGDRLVEGVCDGLLDTVGDADGVRDTDTLVDGDVEADGVVEELVVLVADGVADAVTGDGHNAPLPGHLTFRSKPLHTTLLGRYKQFSLSQHCSPSHNSPTLRTPLPHSGPVHATSRSCNVVVGSRFNEYWPEESAAKILTTLLDTVATWSHTR